MPTGLGVNGGRGQGGQGGRDCQSLVASEWVPINGCHPCPVSCWPAGANVVAKALTLADARTLPDCQWFGTLSDHRAQLDEIFDGDVADPA